MVRSCRKMEKIIKDSPASDNLPSLNEQRKTLARWALPFFGVAVLALVVSLSNGLVENSFAAGALIVSVFGAFFALTHILERARLLRCYQRLRDQAFVRWISDGREVFIGRDAAYYDGVLIEWEDRGFNILTKTFRLDGSIAFVIDRHVDCKGGMRYVDTVTFEIPVPPEHEESAQQALDRLSAKGL